MAFSRACRVNFRRLSDPRLLLAGGVAAGLALHPAKAKTPATRQQVFVWGRGSAMPGGADGDVLWPRRIEWFEQNPRGWKKIAFGPDFGGAIDSSGQLYVWGSFEQRFVGPLKVDAQGAARGQGFEDIQFSAKKMFALTAGRDVLVFDDFLTALQGLAEEKSEPSEPLKLRGAVVDGVPRAGLLGWLQGYRGNIRSMSIGMEHACFVTFQGQLYCVGGNQYGQCGVQPPKQRGPMGALEERQRVEVNPVRVDVPGAVKSVEVGGRHTIAQDVKGRCYGFGDDRRIQLGLGDTRTGGQDERHAYGVLSQDNLGGKNKVKGDIQRAVSYRYYDPHMQSRPVQQVAPLAVNRPEYPPASFVACGEDYTMAVFRDSPDWYAASATTNVVFACGENGGGQCGRSMHQQQQVWSQVRLPKHTKVEQLRCGQAHCLALLKDGRLFAWGSNPQGQVGNGKRSLVTRPVLLTQQPELPSGLAELAEEDLPRTVTPQDLYKRAVYSHVQGLSSKQRTADAPPAAPVTVNLPGTVRSITCGFRNSAVICEIPS